MLDNTIIDGFAIGTFNTLSFRSTFDSISTPTPEIELLDNDGAFLLDNDGVQLIDNG